MTRYQFEIVCVNKCNHCVHNTVHGWATCLVQQENEMMEGKVSTQEGEGCPSRFMILKEKLNTAFVPPRNCPYILELSV